MSDPRDMRAAFEAWAKEEWPNSNPPDNAWKGWQACAARLALAATEPAEPPKLPLTKHDLDIVDMLQYIEGYSFGDRHGKPGFWSHAVALGALRLLKAAYAMPENIKAAIERYESLVAEQSRSASSLTESAAREPAEDAMAREIDAAETLAELGWAWDGDQWQRPPRPAATEIRAAPSEPLTDAETGWVVDAAGRSFGKEFAKRLLAALRPSAVTSEPTAFAYFYAETGKPYTLAFADDTERLSSMIAAGKITQRPLYLRPSAVLEAAPELCPNCDSPMPEGCAGTFKDEGAHCRLNDRASTPSPSPTGEKP